MKSIDLSRVPSFYHGYIAHVKEGDLAAAFQNHLVAMVTTMENIGEQMWDMRYEEGKWSIKEVVQHVIDAERIFCYRALCIARLEDQPLPGFDENRYTAAAKAGKRSKAALISELQTVQQSSFKLFESFDEEQLEHAGISNGKPIYVRAIGYIIIGHTLHHRQVIQERYLKQKTVH